MWPSVPSATPGGEWEADHLYLVAHTIIATHSAFRAERFRTFASRLSTLISTPVDRLPGLLLQIKIRPICHRSRHILRFELTAANGAMDLVFDHVFASSSPMPELPRGKNERRSLESWLRPKVVGDIVGCLAAILAAVGEAKVMVDLELPASHLGRLNARMAGDFVGFEHGAFHGLRVGAI